MKRTIIAWAVIVFAPALFLFAVLMAAVNAAPVPTLRTIPVIVLEGDRSGFTWVHTVDQRAIRICVSHMPIPETIPCYIVTGQRYINGVEQTVVVEVALVAPREM